VIVSPRCIIDRVEVFAVGLPIRRGFTFASGTAGRPGQRAGHVFVKLTDRDGRVGWGEGRPLPAWSYETIETVRTTIANHLGPAVIGRDAFDHVGLHNAMHAVIGRGPSTGQPIAKAAVDLAAHDLCAKAAGLPLRAMLGGSREPVAMTLSYTLTAHDVAALRDDLAEAQAAGFSHYNFKAAVSPATDVAIAEAVRAAAGPDGFVWADANQGYTLPQARQAADAFARAGVDMLEQPLPADQLHLMRQLRTATTLPLAVDEASVSPADFFAHAAAGVVDALVVKLARSGGVWPTLMQAMTARAAGLDLLVSGLTESMLLKLASLQIAAAMGCRRPAALNGSQFTDDAAVYPNKAAIERDGTVTLPDAPGIGIEPDEAALRDARMTEP
jgi:L-alanine-DL-glutamate epimerase-like enolase superfamily enzyme